VSCSVSLFWLFSSYLNATCIFKKKNNASLLLVYVLYWFVTHVDSSVIRFRLCPYVCYGLIDVILLEISLCICSIGYVTVLVMINKLGLVELCRKKCLFNENLGTL